jgi:hypothetical protein
MNRQESEYKNRRRADRDPPAVVFRLRTDLATNEQHPLANVDPAMREAGRQRLIAAILARLASGPSTTSQQVTIMPENPDRVRNTGLQSAE